MPPRKPSDIWKHPPEKIIIYDFSAQDAAGDPIWCFLGVPESRSQAFMSAIQQIGSDVDVTQFGKILASGKGKEAPKAVREEIMKKYGTT